MFIKRAHPIEYSSYRRCILHFYASARVVKLYFGDGFEIGNVDKI